MIRCGFEQGAALMGCTSVQNIFILEYMPKAPELYCKVYLFGLMQCGCRRLENADLCASLGIDSAKAVEAFLYWQDMGLLRIVEQEPLSVEYLSVQAGPSPAAPASTPRSFRRFVRYAARGCSPPASFQRYTIG